MTYEFKGKEGEWTLNNNFANPGRYNSFELDINIGDETNNITIWCDKIKQYEISKKIIW